MNCGGGWEGTWNKSKSRGMGGLITQRGKDRGKDCTIRIRCIAGFIEPKRSKRGKRRGIIPSGTLCKAGKSRDGGKSRLIVIANPPIYNNCKGQDY